MNKRQYLHGMTKWELIINPAQQLYENVLSGNLWVRNGSTPCNSWNLDQFNSYRSKRSVTYTGLEIRKAVCFRKQHDTGIHFSPLSSSIDSLVPYTKIAEIDKYMPLTIYMGLSWNAHRHIYIYIYIYNDINPCWQWTVAGRLDYFPSNMILTSLHIPNVTDVDVILLT